MAETKDLRHMRRALELAEKSTGLASPNPPVGCVIVKNGRIVGEGWHEFAQRDHAEVQALRAAGNSARGATVYLTLEPCVHIGRTPPCTPLLVSSGIRRAFVARGDPNPIVAGKGLEALRAAGIEVHLGLLEEDAGRLIEAFACHVTSGRPLVVSKVAMSLDGRIAGARTRDGRISCPEALEFGQSLRLQMDVILVGSGTVLADDPHLTYRGRRPKARPLHRAILDSMLKTPPRARLLRGAPEIPTLIFCSPSAPARRRLNLEARGAEVIPVPRGPGGLSLKRVLRVLGKRQLLGVLVEGGSQVHGSFVAGQLIDKFYFMVAPLIIGGEKSPPSVGGTACGSIAGSPRFAIVRTIQAGSDLILEAYPRSSRSILSPWRPLQQKEDKAISHQPSARPAGGEAELPHRRSQS